VTETRGRELTTNLNSVKSYPKIQEKVKKLHNSRKSYPTVNPNDDWDSPNNYSRVLFFTPARDAHLSERLLLMKLVR